jgi:hypothetical protein
MSGLDDDRRMFKDRRQRPTRPLSRYMFSGRRQWIRRQTDRKTHLCVDRYSHGLFLVLLLIVSLSILDAHFTIMQVERGAQEINPFMSYLIGQGYMHFFWVKYSLTALAVLVLCIFKNHLIVRFSLPSILILYLGIFFHHVFWFFLV